MITVLLADDHQVVRQGLKALLEREGFHVVAEASDGQQAVQLAKQFQPDVAVLDLAMPILNGLDAAKAAVYNGGGEFFHAARSDLFGVHSH